MDQVPAIQAGGGRARERFVTARWSRWGAASGALLFLLWAPMALIVPRLPDLGSSAEIHDFYRSHGDLLKVVLLLVSVGFFFFLCFLGTLVERLRRAETSGPLTWIAFGAALMFMTSLNVAIGLAATAALLSGTSSPDVIHAVHAAAFVLAAPVALAGTAFFAAIAALSLSAAVFPRWLAWGAVVAALANLGALGGIFSLTGPLNAGNGIVGGVAAPILAWVVWALLASVWLIWRGGENGRPQQRLGQ
jgi:hypothetical protein